MVKRRVVGWLLKWWRSFEKAGHPFLDLLVICVWRSITSNLHFQAITVFCYCIVRYNDLVANEPAGSETGARSRLVTSSIMSSEMYNEIRDLYITAAQRAPVNDIDANVQASFGIRSICLDLINFPCERNFKRRRNFSNSFQVFYLCHLTIQDHTSTLVYL